MSADWTQFDRLLESVLAQLGFNLDSNQINLLHKHYSVLTYWNERVNLTAIRTLEEAVFRHFGESLAVAKVIGPGGGSVVDIGSGAGFPGFPVAVACPDRHVTLVESAGKKAIFLKEIGRMRPNVAVFDKRFEEFGGRSEWAIMRGVASGEVSGHVGDVSERVAVLVSAGKASHVAEELGLGGTEKHELAWDPRTVVLVGRTGA
jgi:16S rRNA (guanine527-N7)-methyltransferase